MRQQFGRDRGLRRVIGGLFLGASVASLVVFVAPFGVSLTGGGPPSAEADAAGGQLPVAPEGDAATQAGGAPSGAQEGRTQTAQARSLENVLDSGAYAVGPLLDRASKGLAAEVAPGGEVVMAIIDPEIDGLTIRRPLSPQSGRLRVTHLGTGASAEVAVEVDFDLRAPLALSPELARAIGFAGEAGAAPRPVLIEGL